MSVQWCICTEPIRLDVIFDFQIFSVCGGQPSRHPSQRSLYVLYSSTHWLGEYASVVWSCPLNFFFFGLFWERKGVKWRRKWKGKRKRERERERERDTHTDRQTDSIDTSYLRQHCQSRKKAEDKQFGKSVPPPPPCNTKPPFLIRRFEPQPR